MKAKKHLLYIREDMRGRLDQFAVMEALAREPSSWYDIRHYPPQPTCRMLLALADWAAESEAKRFAVCRMAFEQRLTQKEIGAALNLSQGYVSELLKPQPVFPRAECGSCGPLTEPRPGTAATTYRRAVKLCHYALVFPARWRVARTAFAHPELTREELARLCGTSLRTVMRSLPPPRIDDDEALPEY